MKKIYLILSIVCILLLSGCNKSKEIIKEEVEKIENVEVIEQEEKQPLEIDTNDKRYVDENSEYNGSYLNQVTLHNDGSVESIGCGRDAGCTNQKGTYTIQDENLRITYNMYQDVTGEWSFLPEYTDECQIVEINKFTCHNERTTSDMVFVIKE